MDTHLGILYVVGHETPRFTSEPREAAITFDPPLEGWPPLSGCGPSHRCLVELGRPMASTLSETWRTGASSSTFARPTSPAECAGEEEASEHLEQGTTGGRACDQHVDAEADPERDPQGIWRPLYSCQCLEADAWPGVMRPPSNTGSSISAQDKNTA